MFDDIVFTFKLLCHLRNEIERFIKRKYSIKDFDIACNK